MKRIATYKICRMSGEVGPKRREGDYQVPEGFYRIEYFWPDSQFYLAGKVSYPNALDRQLGGATPGGDIMLHGGCASIGCISMSDERMEELFVMGTSVASRGEKVEMHIFPTRDIRGLIASGQMPQHHAFWANLAEGLEAFEAQKRVPSVTVGWKGKYDVVAKGG
jgi:murein L,D-transpeptidase YafK